MSGGCRTSDTEPPCGGSSSGGGGGGGTVIMYTGGPSVGRSRGGSGGRDAKGFIARLRTSRRKICGRFQEITTDRSTYTVCV